MNVGPVHSSPVLHRRRREDQHKGIGKGGCSSSRQMTSAPRCFPRDKRSNWTSICGTNALTTSTFTGFRSCKQKKLCSACRSLVVGRPKFVKQHRLPFPNEQNRSYNKLDLIHSDVWGLTQNVILGESPCFISFIDNYSRHSYFYLGEKKSDDFMKRITCGSVYDRRESV